MSLIDPVDDSGPGAYADATLLEELADQLDGLELDADELRELAEEELTDEEALALSELHYDDVFGTEE
ncbi:MAG: hypothetical protein H6619_03445 [Deltaproteobacteria bacterium]|nr:hypothetical protein [Deltaproteobacteria bacterium]